MFTSLVLSCSSIILAFVDTVAIFIIAVLTEVPRVFAGVLYAFVGSLRVRALVVVLRGAKGREEGGGEEGGGKGRQEEGKEKR